MFVSGHETGPDMALMLHGINYQSIQESIQVQTVETQRDGHESGVPPAFTAPDATSFDM